jgi:2-aminoethylphosphonate-pyruvate transaminase
MDRDKILLTPGPLTTTLRTKLAMLKDWGSWDADFNAVTARVRKSLVDIIHGQDSHVVVPLQGSGTFSVEAAVATVVPRDGHVLVLDNGAYCKRAARLTSLMGRRCSVLDFGDHEPVSAAALDAKLKADASITHVLMIHCETGAGVLNPLQAVADVSAAHGKGLIVDAMSSFAALPIDARTTRFDALVAASGKCLEGVPGMGFVFIRKAILTAARGKASRSPWTCTTSTSTWKRPPSGGSRRPRMWWWRWPRRSRSSRKKGGQPARLARYQQNYETLVGGMAALGFKPFLDPGVQAPIIVTFHAPADERYDFKTFYARRGRAASSSIPASSRRSRPSVSVASARSARSRWSRPCTQWRWPCRTWALRPAHRHLNLHAHQGERHGHSQRASRSCRHPQVGRAQGQGGGQRHRRRVARQIPAPRQVPWHGRAVPQGRLRLL